MSVSTKPGSFSIGLTHEVIMSLSRRGITPQMMSAVVENHFQAADFIATILSNPVSYFKRELAESKGVTFPSINDDMGTNDILASCPTWKYWQGTIDGGRVASLVDPSLLFHEIERFTSMKHWAIPYSNSGLQSGMAVHFLGRFSQEEFQEMPRVTSEMTRALSEWMEFHEIPKWSF